MKTKVMVRFNREYFSSIIPGNICLINAYEIFDIHYWESLKSFLHDYSYGITSWIGPNKLHDFSYECGKAFLECCEQEYITEEEYETFCNFMPTYFGDENIFGDIETLFEKKGK